MKEFSESEVAKKFHSKDKAKILIYLSELYHKKSPLNAIQDLSERKLAACKKAKLNPEDQYVQDIMDLKDEVFNELLFHFLGIFQESNRFHKLCADQQLHWRMMEMLMKPFPERMDEEQEIKMMKLRSALSEEADALNSRIERAKSDIFGTDDVIKNAEMKIRKLLTPEARLKPTA
jgi:hypothetical protein